MLLLLLLLLLILLLLLSKCIYSVIACTVAAQQIIWLHFFCLISNKADLLTKQFLFVYAVHTHTQSSPWPFSWRISSQIYLSFLPFKEHYLFPFNGSPHILTRTSFLVFHTNFYYCMYSTTSLLPFFHILYTFITV